MAKYKPSDKSPEIENFLETTFGRTTAIKSGTCVYCKKKIIGFRDALSMKEYTISGLCQECQNSVFSEGE
jgi:hypothetical protein